MSSKSKFKKDSPHKGQSTSDWRTLLIKGDMWYYRTYDLGFDIRRPAAFGFLSKQVQQFRDEKFISLTHLLGCKKPYNATVIVSKETIARYIYITQIKKLLWEPDVHIENLYQLNSKDTDKFDYFILNYFTFTTISPADLDDDF